MKNIDNQEFSLNRPDDPKKCRIKDLEKQIFNVSLSDLTTINKGKSVYVFSHEERARMETERMRLEKELQLLKQGIPLH